MTDYPTPVRTHVGCKVVFRWYETEAEARAVAEIAKNEASRLRMQGYDFGFQMPGAVAAESDGLYRVTCP